MYHFSSKIKEQKTTSKAESYRVKSAASDLDRLSELLQIAANLLKLRGRDSCNHLVVLLRDLHMFLGNAVFNQNCHTCICVDDRYLYVYIISIYLIICAKNMSILYTVYICIFTYIVSYIVYINSWFIMILCSVRMVEQRHITKMKSPQHVASMRLYRFEVVGQLCYKSCKFSIWRSKKNPVTKKTWRKPAPVGMIETLWVLWDILQQFTAGLPQQNHQVQQYSSTGDLWSCQILNSKRSQVLTITKRWFPFGWIWSSPEKATWRIYEHAENKEC